MTAAPEHGPEVLAVEAEEPPVLPLPSPEVHHLGRWEGILGWAVGWIVGMALAAGTIVVFVLR